jgi:hypothetical protein
LTRASDTFAVGRGRAALRPPAAAGFLVVLFRTDTRFVDFFFVM